MPEGQGKQAERSPPQKREERESLAHKEHCDLVMRFNPAACDVLLRARRPFLFEPSLFTFPVPMECGLAGAGNCMLLALLHCQ